VKPAKAAPPALRALRSALPLALLALLLAARAPAARAAGSPAPDLQGAIRSVAAAAVPAVVQIEVAEVVQEYRRTGLGSGVIFRQENGEAFVVTNNHVLGTAGEILVRLADGEEHPATVQGRDLRRDLAVVRFEAASSLAVARFGDSGQLRAGDWVLAVGSPLGLDSSVTIGVVSALGRRGGPGTNISDFIQTDAVINPGNSGGALLNLAGEVIGINTWIASDTGSYEGYGFALPSASVVRSVSDILQVGHARYAWLGVGGVDPPPAFKEDLSLPAEKGALVANLYLGSPAEKAGLQPGDYLTRLGRKRIDGTAELVQAVADALPGAAVPVRYWRAGKPLNARVRLGERLEDSRLVGENRRFWPGLIAAKPEGEAAGGVEVVLVFRGSVADRAGARTGDLIEQVNGESISGLAGFYAALNRGGQSFKLTVKRGKEEVSVDLQREARAP
jgi:serine protease Do